MLLSLTEPSSSQHLWNMAIRCGRNCSLCTVNLYPEKSLWFYFGIYRKWAIIMFLLRFILHSNLKVGYLQNHASVKNVNGDRCYTSIITEPSHLDQCHETDLKVCNKCKSVIKITQTGHFQLWYSVSWPFDFKTCHWREFPSSWPYVPWKTKTESKGGFLMPQSCILVTCKFHWAI